MPCRMRARIKVLANEHHTSRRRVGDGGRLVVEPTDACRAIKMIRPVLLGCVSLPGRQAQAFHGLPPRHSSWIEATKLPAPVFAFLS